MSFPPNDRRLIDTLAAKPISDIVGVIHPSGPCATQSQGQRTWTFTVDLEVWRTDAGPLEHKSLHLVTEVSNRRAQELQDAMNGYQVHHFRARIGTDPVDNSVVALMEEHCGRSDDPELAAAAESLRKPVEYIDPKLGTLILDRRVGWFTARLNWIGVEITVHFCTNALDELATVSNAARALLASADVLDPQARAFAAAQLLEIRNNYWNADEDGNLTPPLTPEDFCARLKPESLTVQPDGEWELWYEDGDLFWGHAVQVVANSDGSFKSADIVG